MKSEQWVWSISFVMLIDSYCFVNDGFLRVLIARCVIGLFIASSVSIMPLSVYADKPMANEEWNRCEDEASIKRFAFDPLSIYEIEAVQAQTWLLANRTYLGKLLIFFVFRVNWRGSCTSNEFTDLLATFNWNIASTHKSDEFSRLKNISSRCKIIRCWMLEAEMFWCASLLGEVFEETDCEAKI